MAPAGECINQNRLTNNLATLCTNALLLSYPHRAFSSPFLSNRHLKKHNPQHCLLLSVCCKKKNQIQRICNLFFRMKNKLQPRLQKYYRIPVKNFEDFRNTQHFGGSGKMVLLGQFLTGDNKVLLRRMLMEILSSISMPL